MNSETLANEIAEFALEKKGKQIAIMNLSQITTVADYFVIISGDSETQIRAIADHIIKKLKDKKIKIYHKEGYENLRWVLLDYVDVIVHIFRNETREYYGLERLWGDANIDLVVEEKNDA